WIDSLRLLKPKNLKLFALVTLKSIGEAYTLIFKYFWWVLLLMLFYVFVALMGFFYLDASEFPGTILMQMAAAFKSFPRILFLFLFYIICVITRPSIEKKDWNYFKSQLFPFIYLLILLLCLPKN